MPKLSDICMSTGPRTRHHDWWRLDPSIMLYWALGHTCLQGTRLRSPSCDISSMAEVVVVNQGIPNGTHVNHKKHTDLHIAWVPLGGTLGDNDPFCTVHITLHLTSSTLFNYCFSYKNDLFLCHKLFAWITYKNNQWSLLKTLNFIVIFHASFSFCTFNYVHCDLG